LSDEETEGMYQVYLNARKIITKWHWAHYRNRLIVDEATDTILCYMSNENSGTWYTVNYARSNNKIIYNLYKEWVK
jgi:predicted Rossmann fold nucleotide-binding protein DprA/Smf involved in DNA uptake